MVLAFFSCGGVRHAYALSCRIVGYSASHLHVVFFLSFQILFHKCSTYTTDCNPFGRFHEERRRWRRRVSFIQRNRNEKHGLICNVQFFVDRQSAEINAEMYCERFYRHRHVFVIYNSDSAKIFFHCQGSLINTLLNLCCMLRKTFFFRTWI